MELVPTGKLIEQLHQITCAHLTVLLDRVPLFGYNSPVQYKLSEQCCFACGVEQNLCCSQLQSPTRLRVARPNEKSPVGSAGDEEEQRLAVIERV
jgi:hypothetical protein